MISRLLVLALLSSRAFAWNGPAHQAIADAALSLISPETQAWVSKTAQGQSIEALSIWPDVNRFKMRWTAKWHYINIPIGAEIQNVSDVMSYCTKTCIVDALYRQVNVVLTTDREDIRRNALAWVIHLVGDIHQPLHCVDDHDRGGNDKVVRFRNRKMNLHELWDYSVTKDGGKTTPIKAEVKARAVILFESSVQKTLYPEDWALEAYPLAKEIYKDFNSPQGTNLGDDYQIKYHPIAIDREAMAAVRLASLLYSLYLKQDPFSRLGR